MRTFQHAIGFPRPSLFFVLLSVLLTVLWLAGGASRATESGQVVVRLTAWLLLIVGILFGDRRLVRPPRPVLILLAAAALLALAQVVPLPPALWQALPGRQALTEVMAASGQPQPWRSWSIVPGATKNALASLVVPFAVLLLVSGLSDGERRWLPGLVLGFVIASTLLAMLQFSGVTFDNPLINDTGDVSGSFANRNHLALFIALGCLLLPAWAFMEGRRPGWRSPVALGIALLFTLMILASGSRAGLALGALALAFGLMLGWKGIKGQLRRGPPWLFPALMAAIAIVLALLVLVSVGADRAQSIDRLFIPDTGRDMRARGLPTVLAMTREYFPWGSGLGGFDQIFRMHEPMALLKPTYFNHAHNDILEIILDAGVPGLLLLGAACFWWAWASVRAWRGGSEPRYMLPKLGSAMILLVLIASAFDYPARTPMIMAMIVIAAGWLAGYPARGRPAALPSTNPLL